jgi:hypothetical protein
MQMISPMFELHQSFVVENVLQPRDVLISPGQNGMVVLVG